MRTLIFVALLLYALCCQTTKPTPPPAPKLECAKLSPEYMQMLSPEDRMLAQVLDLHFFVVSEKDGIVVVQVVVGGDMGVPDQGPTRIFRKNTVPMKCPKDYRKLRDTPTNPS